MARCRADGRGGGSPGCCGARGGVNCGRRVGSDCRRPRCCSPHERVREGLTGRARQRLRLSHAVGSLRRRPAGIDRRDAQFVPPQALRGADCWLPRAGSPNRPPGSLWVVNPAVGSALAGAAVGGDISAANSAGLLRMPRAAWITSCSCIVGSSWRYCPSVSG